MKRISSAIVALLISAMLCACDNPVVETAATTAVSNESTVSVESSEFSASESSATETTANLNVNNLPVYEPVPLCEHSCKVAEDFPDADLGDEYMSALLEVGSYPYRTSYGMGFDSPFTTGYLTSYVNESLGADYDSVTIDDLDFYNTNHYHIKPEVFDADAVNRFIWFTYYSSNVSCEFDSFMVNRAILLSLGLRPMLDEIPSWYIEKYVPLGNTITAEEYDEIIDIWLKGGDRELTADENTLVEVTKYNLTYHDIMNWRYKINLGRRLDNGVLTVDLNPDSMKYQGVIDGCASLGVVLNIEMMYSESAEGEVRVIVPDTPEYFEEIFGRSYESVLEEYGLPVEPVA